MDWLAYPLGDILVWSFDNVMVPVGEFAASPNTLFALMGFGGLFYWMKLQAKYNAEAAANPDQIK